MVLRARKHEADKAPCTSANISVRLLIVVACGNAIALSGIHPALVRSNDVNTVDVAMDPLAIITSKHSEIQGRRTSFRSQTKSERLNNNETEYIFNLNTSTQDCHYYSNFKDIRRCRTIHLPTDDQSCHESVTTWLDVKRCLTYFREPEHTAFELDIGLVGERSSGTKFVIDEIQRCFPSARFPNVRIHRDYTRSKHWFQRTDVTISRMNQVILAVFRDPYEWTAAMIQNPYHSPNHFNGFDSEWRPVPLSWEDFTSRKWAFSNRSESDLKTFASKRRNFCTHGSFYKYHQLDPCITSGKSSLPPVVERGYFPFYELRRNSTPGTVGTPYDNILQLRADKIRNFLLEIPLLHEIRGFLPLRYEDLVVHGTQTMLEQVARMIGLSQLPEGCRPTAPQPQRLGRRPIPDGLREWVNEHLDYEIERLLDYPFQAVSSANTTV